MFWHVYIHLSQHCLLKRLSCVHWRALLLLLKVNWPQKQGLKPTLQCDFDLVFEPNNKTVLWGSGDFWASVCLFPPSSSSVGIVTGTLSAVYSDLCQRSVQSHTYLVLFCFLISFHHVSIYLLGKKMKAKYYFKDFLPTLD